MGTSHGRARATRPAMVFAALGLVVVLTACQWVIPSYSPDGSRHNTAETTIDAGNVASLTASWTADVGSSDTTPVVSAGTLVTVGQGRLMAFSADGSSGCAGTPAICAPLWTSGPTSPAMRLGQPVIVGDHVLVSADTGELRVYDLDGEAGCSGTPVTCAPIGVAADIPHQYSRNFTLTVADGIVYAYDWQIAAFDVDDLITCTTASTPCTPLWRANANGRFEHVVVDDGVVYAADDNAGFETYNTSVVAFDADGETGCVGVPRTCTPAWATSPIGWSSGDLAVVDGTIVVSRNYDQGYDPDYEPGWPGAVLTFDVATCATSVDPCLPTFASSPLYYRYQGMAVAGGAIFIRDWNATAVRSELLVFDLAGIENCGGVPRTCSPMRTMVDPANGLQGWNPVVANGVVYLGPDAFDATGATGCSGTPTVCTPLRSGNARTEAIVVSGRVHLQGTPPGGTNTLIRTLRLP